MFYWPGADFQGLGFAPAAVRLLLNRAECCLELRGCYAVVYVDNSPSKKALLKLGFRPLPLKIANDYKEDYEQEYVYYRGVHKTDRLLCFELNQFFIQMRSQLRVLPLASSTGWQT